MEQQTPIPQIKDEAVRRAKTCYFPILDFGGDGTGGGGVGFPCILSRIKWISKPLFPQILDEAVRRAKTRHFPILDLGVGGGGREGGQGFSLILSNIVALFP